MLLVFREYERAAIPAPLFRFMILSIYSSPGVRDDASSKSSYVQKTGEI